MNISEVQSAVASKLAAYPATAAYLPGLIFDYRQCKKTSGETIATDEDVGEFLASRLSAAGVVFEIGLVSGTKSDERPGRWQVMRAAISLTIAESITVAHTLADDALVNATMFALTAPEADGYESPFTIESFDKEVSEKGYVLHFIKLSVPVEIR